MQYKINNDELMHYGILGMKWGVRNAETRAKYANKGKSGKKKAKRTSLRDRATKAGQRKAEKILAKKKQQRLEAEETRKERILGEHKRLQSVYKDASKYIKVDKAGNIRFTPEFKEVVGVGPEEFDDLDYMYAIADEYHKQK